MGRVKGKPTTSHPGSALVSALRQDASSYTCRGDDQVQQCSWSAARRGGAPSTAAAISAWVAQHYSATTIDGATVYDLTNPS